MPEQTARDIDAIAAGLLEWAQGQHLTGTVLTDVIASHVEAVVTEYLRMRHDARHRVPCMCSPPTERPWPAKPETSL